MKMMKRVVLNGPRDCALVERPVPRAKDDFVVVKLKVIPMCTEYVDYRDGNVDEPMGHEAAGEVVEVAQSGKVAVGDRVVVMPGYWCGKCRHCMSGDYIHCEHGVDVTKVTGNEAGFDFYSEYVVQNDWMLIPIPDDMSYEHASMACCGLGPAFNAMKTMKVDAFDTVLISGLGPVGLGAVINARYRGARVLCLARNQYRASIALSLGAEEVLNPEDASTPDRLKDLTDGYGPTKSVETTGQSMYMRLLVDATRRRGHIAIVGEGGDFTFAISDDMIRNGLNLHGIWHYNLQDIPDMMQMIAEVGDSLDKQITHTFPFSRFEDAWKLQLTGECGKILLYPEEDT